MKLGLSSEPRPPDWGIERTGRMPSLGNSTQQGNWLERRGETARNLLRKLLDLGPIGGVCLPTETQDATRGSQRSQPNASLRRVASQTNDGRGRIEADRKHGERCRFHLRPACSVLTCRNRAISLAIWNHMALASSWPLARRFLPRLIAEGQACSPCSPIMNLAARVMSGSVAKG